MKLFMAIVVVWHEPTKTTHYDDHYSSEADQPGYHGRPDREIVEADAKDFNAGDDKRIDTYEDA